MWAAVWAVQGRPGPTLERGILMDTASTRQPPASRRRNGAGPLAGMHVLDLATERAD